VDHGPHPSLTFVILFESLERPKISRTAFFVHLLLEAQIEKGKELWYPGRTSVMREHGYKLFVARVPFILRREGVQNFEG
jgi:hypothetical protein